LPEFPNSQGRNSNSPNSNRHDVETLAQQLYEASDPAGVPWVERSIVVRDPWLAAAKKTLAAAKPRNV